MFLQVCLVLLVAEEHVSVDWWPSKSVCYDANSVEESYFEK